MAQINTFRATLQKDSALSLDLLSKTALEGQSWLSHEHKRKSGLETPPSEASTPVIEKDLDQLLERADTCLDDTLSVISPGDAPTVAVLGVGYVGTHLVSTFATKYPVIGFDVSKTRINDLLAAQMHDPVEEQKDIKYTSDTALLRRATHFLISVPTLLRPDRTVDASFLCSALQTVENHARRGATVVIESSIAVGMTRELLGPLAMRRGLFAGMSPELYSTVFDTVVPVSSPEVAEMTKLYENCQRMICIAYANEMADACTTHRIDPYEVCRAASTKPFGYMNYTPGLGVGGHCIPVNPFYLLSNSSFPLLEEATERMHERPKRIGAQILERLRARMSSGTFGHRKPRVLVVGMGFKKGQSTLSHSPGIELLKTLHLAAEADVTWADSLVSQDAIFSVPKLHDEHWNSDDLAAFDLILVVFLQPDMSQKVLKTLPAHVEVDWLSMRPN
ncbi:UDP-N-acetyl-D-glucosamine 6-dehydrogenase-like protein [Ilyonectria robusta]